MGKFGEELKKSLIAELERVKESIKDRQGRIEQGQTDMDDCFLSQRVSENSIQNIKMQLEILNGGGFMEIDVVETQDGEVLEPRWVETRYGSKIVANGIFANSMKALLRKTGWKLIVKKVPCWTKFFGGSGGGMCGVFTGRYEVVRWHTNMVTGEYFGFEKFAN